MIYSASLKELSEDKLAGNHLIKEISSLYQVISDRSSYNKLIIHKDFAERYFTPSGLSRFIENSNRVNPNLIIELSNDTKSFKIDEFVNKLKYCRSLEELIHIAYSNEVEFFDTIKELVSSSISYNEELVSAAANMSKLQATIDQISKENEELNHYLSVERRNKLYLSNALSILVGRINNQYKGNVDKKKLFYTDRNSFDKVLYFKEITRVQYFDSFIYYLKEILKVLYNMPARLLVIEGYYATGKVQLYPDLVPHYELKEKDVMSGDILMLGTQPKILEDVLKNPNRVSVLIVVDRAGYKVPHIIGDNVEYFYTVSDLEDKLDGTSIDRYISYSKESLYVPMIKDFKSMDSGQRMKKYSELKITKEILNIMR